MIHNTYMSYHIELDIDFKRNNTKGLYIALEGIDGSGKTTQRDALALYFEEQGKSVVKTREPRKTEGIVGRLVFEILKGNQKVPSVALQYLFTADRALHYKELIMPALEEGKIVISDRCFWSAIPYGILDRMEDEGKNEYDYAMGDAILMGQGILSMYHKFMIPDYTFYLHVPVDVGLERSGKKDDEKEIYETKEKLDKIVLGYDWLLKTFPKEITEIDAREDFDHVTNDIIDRIKK